MSQSKTKDLQAALSEICGISEVDAQLAKAELDLRRQSVLVDAQYQNCEQSHQGHQEQQEQQEQINIAVCQVISEEQVSRPNHYSTIMPPFDSFTVDEAEIDPIEGAVIGEEDDATLTFKFLLEGKLNVPLDTPRFSEVHDRQAMAPNCEVRSLNMVKDQDHFVSGVVINGTRGRSVEDQISWLAGLTHLYCEHAKGDYATISGWVIDGQVRSNVRSFIKGMSVSSLG